MIRTVADLIAHLEDFDGDAPVVLAHQPSYPMEYTVGGVAEAEVEVDGKIVRKVFIGEGSFTGYLPGEASSELGWR